MIEDPNIERVSRLEAARLWDRVEAKMAAGIPFFMAREQVLAEEIPDLSKAFGAEIGKRVTRAIQGREPHKLTKEGAAAVKKYTTGVIAAETIKRKGRLSLMDRICLKLFGVAW